MNKPEGKTTYLGSMDTSAGKTVKNFLATREW